MGVRAESRERTVNAVMALGREQLAEVGAAGLSLRAIARELQALLEHTLTTGRSRP